MSSIKNLLRAFARGSISAIFFVSGVNKILQWDEISQGLEQTFLQWQIYLEESPFFVEAIREIVPFVSVLLAVATFFELAGALLLLSAKAARLGGVFLILFLLPVTIVYHPFWLEIGDQVRLQLTKFLSNLAIIGGLLFLVVGPPVRKAPYEQKKKKIV